MLVEFTFQNFRSFRDEACLSMEATGLGSLKQCLIHYGSKRYLPSVAIFGKNGGGKSNVIRAFWLSVQFIRSAQRTQNENSSIPVKPFMLDDISRNEPTSFDFIYFYNGVKYHYGFSANKTVILEEHLYHWPKGQKALVFSREGQAFDFKAAKKKRGLISQAVASNQLFFSVACTMNDEACAAAMKWFRECVIFARDYPDIPRQLLEHIEDKEMLRSISNYAKAADLGISDMRFEVKDTILPTDRPIPDELPDSVKTELAGLMEQLKNDISDIEIITKKSTLTVNSFHSGLDPNGHPCAYPLDLPDESGGTLQLMRLAPAIERALSCGGVLLVDELENKLHPFLSGYIVSKFQDPAANPNHAQLIFTSHNTELLNTELIRKDQVYFADKDRDTGASELYSISGFSSPTSENIRKRYLMGKYGAVPEISSKEGL